MQEVKIIGAGLAGSEAALQLAKRGIKVKLYEIYILLNFELLILNISIVSSLSK